MNVLEELQNAERTSAGWRWEPALLDPPGR
jgi:hypothetical protein